MNSPATPPAPGSDKPAAATASGSSRRHGHRRRLWLIALGAVVGLAVLAVGAKKLYPRIKLSVGRQNAAEAESALRNGKVELAGQKVKKALALAPGLPEVRRVAAHLCSLKQDPAGINYYQMLISSPDGTLADKTNLLLLAHSTKRLAPARELLRQMLAANSNDVLALQYLVENQLLAEDRERAIKAAAVGLKLDPTNAWFQLNLGSLLIDDPRGGRYQDEGRRLLFSLAISQRPERIPAQNRIARAQDLTKAEMSVLQRQIESRTNRPLEDEMLIYDLRRRQDPDRGAEIVSEALTRYLRDDPQRGLASAITWAGLGRQLEPVLALVPAAVAATNTAVAPLYANVLANLEKWAELEKFLKTAETAIGKVLTAGFRARLAMAQGNRPEAEAQFRSLGSVQDVPLIDARILAEQAEKAGLPGVALDIYQRIARDPGAAVDAARQCIRLLSRVEDLFQLRDVANRLSLAFPKDDSLAWEAAWANLVAGEEIPASWTVMTRLFEKSPTNPAYRHGLAFSELKMGRNADAQTHLQDQGTAFKTLSPRLQVVQVLMLAANDQRENARRLVRQIELKRLRPAEQALVKDLL